MEIDDAVLLDLGVLGKEGSSSLDVSTLRVIIRKLDPLHQTAFLNAPKSERIVPASSGISTVRNPYSMEIDI